MNTFLHEYLTIIGINDQLLQHILDCQLSTFYLIGSSTAGLVGLHYAHVQPKLLYKGCVDLQLNACYTIS